MATTEFVRACITEARQRAEIAFARDPDRDSKITDSQSYAWQFARTADPGVSYEAVAAMAIRRTKSPRSLGVSVRSIDHPRNRSKHAREPADVRHLELFRVGDDPAEIVCLSIDYAAWLRSLTTVKLRVVISLVAGYRTGEIAEMVGLSYSRISQLRRELADSWDRFTE